jgi:hypothetical protein
VYQLGTTSPYRAEVMLAGVPQVVGAAVHPVGYKHHREI